jgi:hypothetical protein
VWRGLAAPVLVAAMLVGCGGGGSGPQRDDYVKANESLFRLLPRFPGSRVESENSSAYRDGESGPVIGYSTRFDLALPADATSDTVAAFFLESLRPEWRLVETLDGHVFNFRRGEAFVSINLEGSQAHVLEVGVDHAYYSQRER